MNALIPTHKFAAWLLDHIDRLLTALGLERSGAAEDILYVMIIILCALFLGWAVRKCIVFVAQKMVYSRRSVLVEGLQSQHLVERMSHVIPPLVFLALVPFAFDTDSHTLAVIEKVVLIYFLAVLGWTLDSLFTIIWTVYDRKENVNNLPLRGILNVAKGISWIVIAIIGISVVIGKSPAVLLTGLGAFAAALMLVFKDSILGFVAGLQLAFNDMLHVGDWISVPGTIANGIVTDVSLTAVKVRNWNNTTVTIPPYTLVSTSLQNWTKMKQRGRRQIERSVLIDVSTVCPTTPEMLEAFKKQPYMNDYITAMEELKAQNRSTCLATDTIPVNGSIATNLGVFRAYCGLMLLHHPFVALGDEHAKHMIRLMEQTPYGIPLQIFCYVNTVDWPKYEAIQSDIIETIIAAAPAFGLSAYSAPASRDMVNIGAADRQALPYTGDRPVDIPSYNRESNYVIPPNTAGDPGIPDHTAPIEPAPKRN